VCLGLELLAHRVALVAAERQHLRLRLAHVEADMAKAGFRLSTDIDRDCAERRPVELDEILVRPKRLRRRAARASDAGLLELGVRPDRAPRITELAAMRLLDEFLDAPVLAGLVEAEVLETEGHPFRFGLCIGHVSPPCSNAILQL